LFFLNFFFFTPPPPLSSVLPLPFIGFLA